MEKDIIGCALRLMLLFWVSGTGFSQATQSFKVTGRVTGLDAQPVEQLMVRLYPVHDSTVMQSVLTDGAGKFRFSCSDSADYVLRIDTRFYQPEYRLIRPSVTGGQEVLIALHSSTLQEVTVKEKRDVFQVDPEKITVNVSGSALLSGGHVLDVLEKTPRILVDPFSRTVSVDGKTGLQIYLNNHRVQLTSDQVATYLKGIPASSVERIELLTNPPGRYDASFGSVLNIITRKLDSDGTSLDVSVSPGIGRFGKLNSSANLSLRHPKWSAYVLYTPQIRSTYFSYEVSQLLDESALTGSIRGNQYRRLDTRQQGLRLGGDWNLTKKLVVGANVYGFQSTELMNNSSSNQYQSTEQPISEFDAQARFDNRFRNVVGNINAHYTLAKSSLSFDADLGHYTDKSTTQSDYYRQGDVDSSFLTSYFPNAIYLRSIKADIDTRLSQKITLEAGLKISASSIQSIPMLGKFSPSFDTLAAKLTQAFDYEERVRASYVGVNGTFLKSNPITFQASLRYEHTELVINTLSDRFTRMYDSFFPAAMLQRTLTGGGKLTLTYNRRINRPNFTALNPAYVFLDPFTITRGNPFLTPQFATNFQLGYQFPSKHSVMLSLLENTNRITEVIFREDAFSPVLYNTQINFNRERRFSMTYSFPVAITKSWKMQTTLIGYRVSFTSPINGEPFAIQANAVSLNNLHTIRLGPNWTADIQLITRTATALGFMHYKPLFLTNVGLGRPLWNNRGSIKLSGADIFHTVTLVNYGSYGLTDVRFRHRYETQTAFITLSYRFGNEKLKRVNQRATASENEQERTQK